MLMLRWMLGIKKSEKTWTEEIGATVNISENIRQAKLRM